MNKQTFAAAALLAAALAPAAMGAEKAVPPQSLSCRAQVVAFCNKGCEFGAGPADLALDFKKGVISYCRGEQCNDGKIKVETQDGQWDNEAYMLFTGKVKHGGKVWGLISLKAMTFYAKGDVGDMFGTCSSE